MPNSRSIRALVAVITLEVGTVFAGDFLVERPLAAGGMGAVYVARQLSTDIPRALKIMHPQHVERENLRAKFEAEAKIGARIKSDHVVQVVAAGFDEGSGIPWLAMELLEGQNLDEYRRKHGPLSLDRVIAIYEQLCHALGRAHDLQIVHRDLKPENIFLSESRTVGVPFMVKLLDLGIAKMIVPAHTSRTGAVGTPLYMAPEQYRGRGLGPHTDVWALGLIAFNLLTDLIYWTAAYEPDSNAQTIMFQIMAGELPSASERAADSGRAHLVPPAFDAWFARCVDRDPDARFANADEVLEALQRVAVRRGAVAACAIRQHDSAGPMSATQPADVDDPSAAAGDGPSARQDTNAFVAARDLESDLPPSPSDQFGAPPSRGGGEEGDAKSNHPASELVDAGDGATSQANGSGLSESANRPAASSRQPADPRAPASTGTLSPDERTIPQALAERGLRQRWSWGVGALGVLVVGLFVANEYRGSKSNAHVPVDFPPRQDLTAPGKPHRAPESSAPAPSSSGSANAQPAMMGSDPPSHELVAQAAARRIDAIGTCLQRRGATATKSLGQVAIRLRVHDDGTVGLVEVDASGTISPPVSNCIAEALAALRFTPFSGAALVVPAAIDFEQISETRRSAPLPPPRPVRQSTRETPREPSARTGCGCYPSDMACLAACARSR